MLTFDLRTISLSIHHNGGLTSTMSSSLDGIQRSLNIESVECGRGGGESGCRSKETSDAKQLHLDVIFVLDGRYGLCVDLNKKRERSAQRMLLPVFSKPQLLVVFCIFISWKET